MAKAKNKTVETRLSVTEYLNGIEDPQRRKDCKAIAKIMREISGNRPKMWGDSIVGYGKYHYKYESGREGDFLRIGYASRAKDITIYILPGYEDFSDELARLGKHRKGKSCLYIKRLSDVDEDVLREMIQKGYNKLAEQYPV